MILYLHGFNSAASSAKASSVQAYCERLGLACAVPDLPHRPAEAIKLAQVLCADSDFVVAVGSSMGGYYTTWLVEHGHANFGVVINPAVDIAPKLAEQIGKEQENYSTRAPYMFSQQHIDDLEALVVTKVAKPERYLLLVQEGDELLDYREAVKFYAGSQQIVEPEGDHSFVGLERHLPAIARLALAGVRSNPLS